MIFIATGTAKSSSFMKDAIIALDNALENKTINEEVIAQIGNVDYKPKNFTQYFDFTTNFEKYINNAEFIISADGAGTIFESLHEKKKIIVVVNPKGQKYGASANDFIGTLEEHGYLIWCKNISKIADCVNLAKKHKFKEYIQPKCNIAEIIESEYLKWLNKK